MSGKDQFLDPDYLRQFDTEVIDSGPVGSKAQQLIEKTPDSRQIGFHTPPRAAFASNFFDTFISRNRLGTNIAEASSLGVVPEQIIHGGFTAEQFAKIERVAQPLSGTPVMVRSSANDDALGTGIYYSEATYGSVKNIRKAIQRVLASYFTPDAYAFRTDVQSSPGMGIIIEPMIGNWISYDYYYVEVGKHRFAPALSGFAYTSTSTGEGYIVAEPGLGCAVNTRYGERLTRRNLQSYSNLQDYIDNQYRLMILDAIPTRNSRLIGTDDGIGRGSSELSTKVFYPPRHYRGGMEKGGIADSNVGWYKIYRRTDLNKLFDLMETLEAKYQTPQYIEWAFTLEDDTPKFWVIQIADVNLATDNIDFVDHGDSIFEAHSVVGSGVRECDQIVICESPDDINSLRIFNSQNSNYILIFDGNLTSVRRQLNYSEVNNASVILEIPVLHSGASALEHFGGAHRLAGRFFGVLDGQRWSIIQLLESMSQEVNGLRVSERKFKVVASERQNRLTIQPMNKLRYICDIDQSGSQR